MAVVRILEVMDSSNVARCYYDKDKRKLTIAYSGGEQYRYDDVTPKMFGDLCAADSVGQYVNAVIKKQTFVKI